MRLISRAATARSISSDTGFALGSLKGPHREDNQDRIAVAEIYSAKLMPGPMRVGVVCDGLGGLQEGGPAATIAIAGFLTEMVSATTSGIHIHDAVGTAIVRANDQVYSRLGGRGGTTLTALVITNGGFAVGGHVGDSRLYRITADKSLELLSKDDTIQGVLRDQSSFIDEDELDNRLLQYVGIGDDISPHLFSLPTFSSDSFMLTSDGMHGLGRKVLDGLSENSASPLDLVRKACFVAEAVGVHDNASIAVLSPERPSGRPDYEELTLKVWTPLENLELWIGDAFQRTYQVADEAKKSSEEVSATIAKKPKRRSSGARKSKKPTPKADAKKGRSKDDAPQFDIKFGKQ